LKEKASLESGGCEELVVALVLNIFIPTKQWSVIASFYCSHI